MPRALAVGLLLTLVVGLRLYGIDDKVFWHDEVYSTLFANGYRSHDWQQVVWTGNVLPIGDLQRFFLPAPGRTLIDTVLGLARDEPQHPPIYYILARAWTALVGNGPARLRLLTIPLGLLSIPAMRWLAHEVYGDRRRISAALLVALSPFFVLYSQECREYALWGTLTLASCALLLRAIRRTEAGKSTARDWLGLAVLTALSLYTAFSAAGVILGQVLYVVARERGRLTKVARSAAASMTLAALLFLPWAIVLHARLDAFRASMAWTKEIVIPRTDLLASFAQSLSRATVDLQADATGAGWIGVAVGASLTIGGLVGGFVAMDRKKALLPLFVALIPVLLLLVPDLAFGGIRSVSTRYFTPTLAMGLLGIAALDRRIVAAAVLAAALSSTLHLAETSPWTKGISRGIPPVAAAVNEAPPTLIIANRERHQPGNLFALAAVVQDGTQVQVLSMGDPLPPVPDGFESVFLFSPTPPQRDHLTARGWTVEPVYRDLHLELWAATR